MPEDACSPLAPLAVAAVTEAAGNYRRTDSTDDEGSVGDGGAPAAAVLVKRGGCSFGVKAKNVQVGVGVYKNLSLPNGGRSR